MHRWSLLHSHPYTLYIGMHLYIIKTVLHRHSVAKHYANNKSREITHEMKDEKKNKRLQTKSISTDANLEKLSG